MKNLTLIAALLMGGALQAATIKIEATTESSFHAWFMPTNHNSTSTVNLGQGYSCTNMVRGKDFQLLCRKDNKNIIIYQDKTPQKDATIATPHIVIKITTLGK
jgi:hypothetical protein